MLAILFFIVQNKTEASQLIEGICLIAKKTARYFKISTKIFFIYERNDNKLKRGDKKFSQTKSNFAVNLNQVSKSFGAVQAAKNLDLQIETGTVFGFLGPNESGKSTTMKMIKGLLKADSGNLTVCGIMSQTIRGLSKKLWVMFLKVPVFTVFLLDLSTWISLQMFTD